MNPYIIHERKKYKSHFVSELATLLTGSSNQTLFNCAVKLFQRKEPYYKERNAYLRLKERGVDNVNGFHVPKLLDFDDEILGIEMTIVSKPYLLDFAGAFLDSAPKFPEDVLEDWEEQKREQFGSRWPVVESVLQALRTQHGVFFTDVSPDNIAFLD